MSNYYQVIFKDRHGDEYLLSERYATPEQANNAIRRFAEVWRRDVETVYHRSGNSYAMYSDGVVLEWWRAGQAETGQLP